MNVERENEIQREVVANGYRLRGKVQAISDAVTRLWDMPLGDGAPVYTGLWDILQRIDRRTRTAGRLTNAPLHLLTKLDAFDAAVRKMIRDESVGKESVKSLNFLLTRTAPTFKYLARELLLTDSDDLYETLKTLLAGYYPEFIDEHGIRRLCEVLDLDAVWKNIVSIAKQVQTTGVRGFVRGGKWPIDFETQREFRDFLEKTEHHLGVVLDTYLEADIVLRRNEPSKIAAAKQDLFLARETVKSVLGGM